MNHCLVLCFSFQRQLVFAITTPGLFYVFLFITTIPGLRFTQKTHNPSRLNPKLLSLSISNLSDDTYQAGISPTFSTFFFRILLMQL